jgi:hypothetical protein
MRSAFRKRIETARRWRHAVGEATETRSSSANDMPTNDMATNDMATNDMATLTPLPTLDDKASIGRALEAVLRDGLIVRTAIPG